MNKIRLTKLAEVLENFKTEIHNLVPLPNNGQIGKFSLDSWGAEGETLCSTTACAAGTAALHPWFRAKGLKMDSASNYYGKFHIAFKGQNDFEACEKFFNINEEDAFFLFSPGSYPYGHQGEKSVANRIRYLLRGGKSRGKYAGLKG